MYFVSVIENAENTVLKYVLCIIHIPDISVCQPDITDFFGIEVQYLSCCHTMFPAVGHQMYDKVHKNTQTTFITQYRHVNLKKVKKFLLIFARDDSYI